MAGRSIKENLKSGKLLLADPYMQDPHFKRSVILLSDYSQSEGVVGFILNKPISKKINSLIDDFPEIESPVYYGGPVAPDTLHYVHDVGDILDGSIPLSDGLYWSGDYEKLKFLIESKLITNRNIKFFVGYSGWSPDQLEAELEGGSWILADMDPNYAFNIKSTQLWNKAMRNKGGHYTVIAEMPDSFILN